MLPELIPPRAPFLSHSGPDRIHPTRSFSVLEVPSPASLPPLLSPCEASVIPCGLTCRTCAHPLGGGRGAVSDSC